MALAELDALGDGARATDGGVTAPHLRRRGRFSGKTYVGFALIGIFVFLAVFGSTLAPYNPSLNVGPSLAGPTSAHLLGTTQNSQDVLSQLLVGARTTLYIGFVAGAVATVLAVLIGLTAGYVGGLGDETLSLVANLFLVIPALPLLIVMTSYIPHAGPTTLALVLSLTGWAWGARVLRAQTLSIRRRDYVDAARIAGERTWRIVLFEILPNEVAIVAATFLSTVLFAILTQVALDFLGLVNPSGAWTWGTMLYWAQSDGALNIGAWWWFVPPGLCIALVGTGLALANFGLDEWINPRLRTAGLTRRSELKLARMGVTAVRRTPPIATPDPGGRLFTPVRRADATWPSATAPVALSPASSNLPSQGRRP